MPKEKTTPQQSGSVTITIDEDDYSSAPQPIAAASALFFSSSLRPMSVVTPARSAPRVVVRADEPSGNDLGGDVQGMIMDSTKTKLAEDAVRQELIELNSLSARMRVLIKEADAILLEQKKGKSKLSRLYDRVFGVTPIIRDLWGELRRVRNFFCGAAPSVMPHRSSAVESDSEVAAAAPIDSVDVDIVECTVPPSVSSMESSAQDKAPAASHDSPQGVVFASEALQIKLAKARSDYDYLRDKMREKLREIQQNIADKDRILRSISGRNGDNDEELTAMESQIDEVERGIGRGDAFCGDSADSATTSFPPL